MTCKTTESNNSRSLGKSMILQTPPQSPRLDSELKLRREACSSHKSWDKRHFVWSFGSQWKKIMEGRRQEGLCLDSRTALCTSTTCSQCETQTLALMRLSWSALNASVSVKGVCVCLSVYWSVKGVCVRAFLCNGQLRVCCVFSKCRRVSGQ